MRTLARLLWRAQAEACASVAGLDALSTIGAIGGARRGELTKKRTTKKPKVEPKWRTVEKVSALIERMLDPSAAVEHDLDLPDLTTPGIMRQCDVVVTTGPETRRTRSIVEVQKRGRKVELPVFEAWVAKMRGVGAQHLVCVSSVGYPASVIAKAAQIGPAVRLATLADLKGDHPLLHAAFGSARIRFVESREVDRIQALTTEPNAAGFPEGIQIEAPVFRNSADELLSIAELATRATRVRGNALPAGEHEVTMTTDDQLILDGVPAAGRFRLSFAVTLVVTEVVFSFSAVEYQQLDVNEPTAWVLSGEATRPSGGGGFRTRIIFRTAPDGRLVQHSAEMDGLLPGEQLQAQFGSAKRVIVVPHASAASCRRQRSS